MNSLAALGRALARSALLYPETLAWHHPQLGAQTCRCGVTALEQLPVRDREAFLSTPGFDQGNARVIVHPDDLWPAVGSTCDHPRFRRLELLAIGPESYWTGQRQGAAAWTN